MSYLIHSFSFVKGWNIYFLLSVGSPLLCLLHIYYSLVLVLVKYLKHASSHYSQASYLPLQVSLNQRQQRHHLISSSLFSTLLKTYSGCRFSAWHKQLVLTVFRRSVKSINYKDYNFSRSINSLFSFFSSSTLPPNVLRWTQLKGIFSECNIILLLKTLITTGYKKATREILKDNCGMS